MRTCGQPKVLAMSYDKKNWEPDRVEKVWTRGSFEFFRDDVVTMSQTICGAGICDRLTFKVLPGDIHVQAVVGNANDWTSPLRLRLLHIWSGCKRWVGLEGRYVHCETTGLTLLIQNEWKYLSTPCPSTRYARIKR